MKNLLLVVPAEVGGWGRAASTDLSPAVEIMTPIKVKHFSENVKQVFRRYSHCFQEPYVLSGLINI